MRFPISASIVLFLNLANVGCSTEESNKNTDLLVDRESIIQNRLSSVEEDVEKLLRQLTLEEKISLVHASGKFHVNAIERVGIPEMWLSDGPHGVRHQIQRHSWASAELTDDHSTYLPHLTSVAASWDRNMATLHGNVLGSEARHRGKDIILGPGINLARLPTYGRNFEYMGEDPYLVSQLVVPEVKAIQQHDVAANAKHFALNNQELNRIGVNAKPDERTLREVYLMGFEAAVKEGGVYSIMGAYNQYYGTNANQSHHLVKEILKDEWGFDGVLLTDWHVDINTYDAAMNGLDLEMGTDVESYNQYFLADAFLDMIKSGKIPESVLDDKVKRILRLQHRVGLMDKNRLPGERNTLKHQLAARTIAEQGVVLLKNSPVPSLKNKSKPVLPLDATNIKNLLVIGPNANKQHGTGGGSSEVKSLYEITPYHGLVNYLDSSVNIQLMRARSSELSPIASDYVASRHWTGTPAWNIAYYESSNRKSLISESWIVDAKFTSQDKTPQHVTMSAKIKPLQSGLHVLKVASQGVFTLSVDGEKVIDVNNENTLENTEYAMNLNENQEYNFDINYDGSQSFVLGWDAPENLFASEAEYLAAAKNADAVIYVGGLSHGDDRESIDRPDMKLPHSQDEIISKLLDANPATIVLLVAGSAVEMPWIDKANALIWGWYGGMEAGNAFANVIFGDVNPSGKMPITLPKRLEDTAPIALNDYNAIESLYSEGVFIGYRWFEQQQISPIFPFGHGLSYTEFSYSDLTLANNSISIEQLQNGQSISVDVTITNTGNVAGAEVVQLYLHDTVASVPRPLKELKGFDKVFLKPNESKTVRLILNQRDLSYWDVKRNDWLAESGEFTIYIGSSLEDIRQQVSFTLE